MDHPRFYSPYDEPFWRSINEESMRIQCCSECGRCRYPPGACCPNCLSTEATWKEVSGRGRILSWTTFHRQYLPAYPAPTTVVAVELEEGPIFISNIDDKERSKLKVNVPVRLIYGKHLDGYTIPRFTLASE